MTIHTGTSSILNFLMVGLLVISFVYGINTSALYAVLRIILKIIGVTYVTNAYLVVFRDFLFSCPFRCLCTHFISAIFIPLLTTYFKLFGVY